MYDGVPLTGAAFRAACGRFATGVAIVTTTDSTGGNWGLTINSFSSVSLDPPLILFSIDNAATSLGAFLDASDIAVNILACDQVAISERFSVVRDQDRFEGVDLDRSSGAPVLSGCLCALECKPETSVPGGDHTVFIARVMAARINSDEETEPLVYYRGRYSRLHGKC